MDDIKRDEKRLEKLLDRALKTGDYELYIHDPKKGKFEKVEEEFKDIPWKRREETEFKDVKFVSVYVGKKIFVRGHYRKINGRKVYVKPHYRNPPRRRK